jgi:hypothetical protein
MPEDNFDQDRHLGQVRDQELARQTEQRRLEQERERLEQEREQQDEDERLRTVTSSGSRPGASGRGGLSSHPSRQGPSLLSRIRRSRAEAAPPAASQSVAQAPGHRSSSWVFALCALLVGAAALGYGTWRGTSTFGQSLRQWMGMPAIDAGLQQRTTEPTGAPEQAEAALPDPVLPSPMEQGHGFDPAAERASACGCPSAGHCGGACACASGTRAYGDFPGGVDGGDGGQYPAHVRDRPAARVHRSNAGRDPGPVGPP